MQRIKGSKVVLKKIIEGYRKRYYISPVDLADSGETNRLNLIYVSPFLFLFGAVLLPFFLFYYRDNLSEHIPLFLYYTFYIVISLYMYLHSKLVKNVAREKAYILKTIPFYISLVSFLVIGVFHVYDSQPFNAIITCGIIVIVALYLFSFSPFVFLFLLVSSVCGMAPKIYASYNVTGLLNIIMAIALLYCLALYKRRSEKKIILFLRKQKQNLEAKTFGNFTLLYENKVVKFSRTKSNELLAYLIYKNGSSVNTKELISVLYGTDADSSRYGANLRNLIVDIKHSLSELGIQNFFITEYNNFRINPEVIKCDYYDFMAGDKQVIKSFTGAFMSQYKWAEDVTAFMEYKVLKKL